MPQAMGMQHPQQTPITATHAELPAPGGFLANGQPRPPVDKEAVWKTEICAKWVSGLCNYGEGCQFAHG